MTTPPQLKLLLVDNRPYHNRTMYRVNAVPGYMEKYILKPFILVRDANKLLNDFIVKIDLTIHYGRVDREALFLWRQLLYRLSKSK